MAFIDYANETEEERRRRLEQEAAAMYNEPVGSGGSYPDTPSAFGQYIDRRLGAAGDRIAQAGEYFTDPAAAFERRMAQQAEAADTEVQTQTVKTYGDGSQERIVKTQMPAPVTGPAVPEQPAMAAPAPQMAPAPQVAPVAPEAAEPRPQVFPAFAQAVQQARPAQPAAPAIPPEMANQPVAMPALPEPGPGVQVASADAAAGLQAAAAARAQQQAQQAATQAPAATPSLQQIAQTMPAPILAPAPEAEWVRAANDAGNDFLKLAEVAGKYPESRQAIVDKLQTSFKNKTLEDQANKLLSAAQSGDLKAWNQIQQAIKPETGRAREEVTVNDYVKAYMFKRLGLDALAQDVQNKIIGKETKFGQITVGGSNWATETDSTGNIVRARDEDGNVATEATLNKLRAAGQKFGTQAFGFTGGSQVIPAGQPDAGQEYRQRTNSVSGAIENVITTGPNAGKLYTGAPGQDKSVGTQGAKALNQAFIDFSTKPTTAAATEALKTAALLGNDAYNQTLAAIRSRSPEIFGQLPPGAGLGGAAAPSLAADPAAVRRAQSDIESIDREISRVKPNAPGAAKTLETLQTERAAAQQRLQQAGGSTTAAPAQGGGSLLKQTEQAKANIGTAAAIDTTRGQEAVKNVEKLATDTATNADAAGQTATVARRIRTAVTDNPEIPGMLTKTNNKGLDIITATVAAIDAGLGGSDAIQAAAKQMNFNARQVAVFDQIKGDLTELALARARENKGQGTFTDFERRLFAETTGDLARNPASAIQYRMEIFEYAADKTMRKSEFIEDYRSRNPNATAGQINNAWRKESKKADDEFEKRLRDTYINPKFKVIRP